MKNSEKERTRDAVIKATIEAEKKTQNKQNVCLSTHTFLCVAFFLLGFSIKAKFQFGSDVKAQPKLDKLAMRCDKIQLKKK